MTLGNLIRSINVQGVLRISIWNEDDNEVFCGEVRDDNRITIYEVEALLKGLSKQKIIYMYPINDTLTVEVDNIGLNI